MTAPRDIQLRIRLAGGHSVEVTLLEDAPELKVLYAALASPESTDTFVQLPRDGASSACSFRTSQLVSIESTPPVVLDDSSASLSLNPGASNRVQRPRHIVIDDFLGPREHQEMLALALASEQEFEAGTEESRNPEYRQNLVIMGFGDTVHSRLIQSRLLMWYPLLAKSFGIPIFPLDMIESQFTAAGDGQFYKVHADDGPATPRVLSCIYYLHREPRGFGGGALRLYDAIEIDGERMAAKTFTTIVPRNNRMVVFPSEEFHEAMPVRCPSGDFADYRFAVTNWIHRSDKPNKETTFGFGQFRCGVVAPQFVNVRNTQGSN